MLLAPYRPAPAYPPTPLNRKLFFPEAEHLCRIFSVVAHVKTVLRSAPDEVHTYVLSSTLYTLRHAASL